ncbi:sialic acid-binding Ig-like lectin 14 [Salvelinus alpinus]|uniref:sialic acid-binding Ig-like lectin 14 n=1 Tax=Salvelinus alpinus TaxID=8036 RepID=UPI0039FCF9CF
MSLRTAGSVLVVFLWSVAVVLGQDGWSVTYTTQSICALKGSTVELTCSYTYPSGTVTSTFWFTKMETGVEHEDIGQDPENAGRLEYHGDKKKDCTLRITDLRERDSATYKFSFTTDQTRGRYYGDPGVTLSVTALQVKVTPSHWSKRKTLTCKTTSCPLTSNPTYTWYKNGQVVTVKTSTYSVLPNAADSYSCAVKGHEDLHSPAVCECSGSEMQQSDLQQEENLCLKGVNSGHILYLCLQVKVTPAAEGQKTLTCSTTCTLTDNPTYIWYRNGWNVQDNSSPMYSISSEDEDSSFSCAVKGHEDLSSPAVCEYSTIVQYST